MPPLFPPPPPSSPPLHRFLLRPWNRRRRSPMRPPPPRRRRPHTTAGAAPNCPLHTRRVMPLPRCIRHPRRCRPHAVTMHPLPAPYHCLVALTPLRHSASLTKHYLKPEPAHALADAACYAPSVRVGNDCRRPRYRRCPRPMSPGSMLMNSYLYSSSPDRTTYAANTVDFDIALVTAACALPTTSTLHRALNVRRRQRPPTSILRLSRTTCAPPPIPSNQHCAHHALHVRRRQHLRLRQCALHAPHARRVFTWSLVRTVLLSCAVLTLTMLHRR
ncbi:hypothetical protein B0H14DRAFT_2698940 [Mycena olivaceomarginata]|nr:hypothetical protein B0H14DRAFT_2698940 [Mycena olivaceomarginata]